MERETRYRTLFGAMDEGFCVVEMLFDAEGKPVDYRFLESNDAFGRMTGITAEAVRAGRSARELYPTLEEFWFETYGRVATTGESVRLENRVEAMGKWFEVHAFRIGGDGSREVGVLFKDVSERRRAEVERERLLAEAREGEAFLALVTDRLPVRIGYLGPDYRYRYLNGAYERAFGIPPGKGAGMTVAELAGEEVFRIAKPFLDRALAGDTHTQEFSVPYTFGERRVEVQYNADPDDTGRVRGVVIHVLDVTERARAEAEREQLIADLAIERERLEALFKMSPSAITVIRGEDLRFEFANDAYLRLVGRSEIVGKTLFEALPDIEGQGFAELLRGVMATGEPFYAREVAATLQPMADEPTHTVFIDLLYQALREADGTVSGVFVHAVDITEQVRARQIVSEREELFRTVFEQAPDDAILVMDRDRLLTAWNPAAERITGWSAGETVARSADLIFTPEDRAGGTPVTEAEGAARTGKAIDERWHMRKDGSRFWGSGTMNALHDAEGSVRGFLKVFRDATERYVETQTLAFLSLLTEAVVDMRDADAILETTERMLGGYLGASRVTFGEVGEDGETVSVRGEWGPDMPSLVGTHRLETLGERIVESLRSGRTSLIREAESEFRGEPILATLRAMEVRAAISVPILKDGRLASVFVVHGREPREWTEDEVSLVQQVADRMSAEIERARAEAALRTSEARFRQLVDLAPSTVWFGEIDGGLSYISGDFYEATGLTPEEALPNGWAATIHPDDLAGVSEAWAAARRNETTYDTEFRIRYRDGGYRWISVRAVPLRDPEGSVTGWLGSNSDIQAQKETEETLKARVDARTEELQRTVREAEGFNYSISHDLRTPLRAMVATASILLEELGEELDEEHRALLVRQAENAKRMGRLIDELLRLSRLARVEVVRQPLDMSEKARSVFEELSAHHGTNGCRVEVQPGMVAEGDPGLVRTVLHNLLGNACKFSPQGGTVRVLQEGNVFSVSDEGVGFDMRFAPKIFLPFERLVSESEFEGTGIGLANVKRIVERHGGRVWVESVPGEGATFSFTLAA